VMRGDRPMA